jgi:hypothetical protein
MRRPSSSLWGSTPSVLRALPCFGIVLGGALFAWNAHATEPKKATEPRLMNEPGEVTNVVDAFDEDNGNPFDVHITLGYQHSWNTARILRETSLDQPGLSSGRFVSNRMNVANYAERTSRLNTRLDVGLYKDIALFLRIPFILSNTRELTDVDGSGGVQSVVLQGSPGEQLFRLPFTSPTRSGIEYLALGFDFGIFNQTRDPSKPTWVFGFETRLNVSEAMHACNPSPQGLNQNTAQVDCAHPSDINRNGISGDGDKGAFEGSFNGKRKAGVSRGTTVLEIHSFMSRRIKYIEPYGGFRALLEFANSSSDYGATNLEGVLTSHPPLRGQMIMGVQVIPWEMKERFQRLSFDARFTGTYVSEGRDYSPLFDALGSSDAASMRLPQWSAYTAGPNNTSVVDQGSQKTFMTGLTHVAAHGTFRISGQAQFQAGEYIKFQLGLGYTHIQAHDITGDQPCNPDFKNNIAKSGPCKEDSATTRSSTGIPNPLYRAPVDAVGRRFLMDNAKQIDAWVNAIVMF